MMRQNLLIISTFRKELRVGWTTPVEFVQTLCFPSPMAETHVSEMDMSISTVQVERSISVVAGTMAQSDASLVALTAAVTTLTDAVSKLTVAMQNQTTPWNSSLVHTPHNAVNEFEPSPTAANDVQMQFGLNIASAQARKALLTCGSCWQDEADDLVHKLHTAVVLMSPPICSHRVAQAYDLALEVDDHIRRQHDAQSGSVRHALLLVRETLVLSVCHQQQMTKVAFEFCMQCLFKKAITGEPRSQLFLAHEKVMQHGTDEALFNIYVAKVHMPALQPEEVKALWSVYERCTYLHLLSEGWDVIEEKTSKKKARTGKKERERLRRAHEDSVDAAETAEHVFYHQEAQSSPTEWLDAGGRHALV